MADEDVVEDNMRSLFGSDFEDSGSEYCPSEQHSSSDLEDILQEGLDVAGSSEIQEDGTARKPKETKNPFKIFFKYSNNPDVLFQEVDIKKRNSIMIQNLNILYPEGHAISDNKKKDLLELLNFIPPVHHSFYKELKTSAAENDMIFNNDLIDD